MRAMAVLCLGITMGLVGCVAPRHAVIKDEAATSARPDPLPNQAGNPTGGIFQHTAYRPLFEDRKPRFVGDILTIEINERLNASQKANLNTERTTEIEAETPVIAGVFGKNFKAVSAAASTTNAFDGKGENASSNLFTGTITVTVVEVLANGNLVVAGEKQIGVRRNSEVLKFRGVVNPDSIRPGNVVSSTQVADARLDYRGGGTIEEAQMQGWLARFFNVFSPF